MAHMPNSARTGLAAAQDLLNKPVSLWWLIPWLSAIYWPVTITLASRKQFWNDELFTYYIGALNTFPRIWSTLLTGVDQNPPLFYWLSHKAAQVAGANLIGLRLPAMAGFWLAAVCLCAFVSRRLPAVYGLIAALVLIVSNAYLYAYEARPYGLVVGFAAAALLCWQRAEGPGNLWWAAGLALALGLAISVHYYSVLLFVPIAAAEAYRAWANRRLNGPVWLALAAAASPLLLYLPLVRGARSYSGAFWSKPRIGSLVEFLSVVVNPALLALIGVAGLWALFTARKTLLASPDNPTRSAFPASEVVAALGMLGVLPLAIALGKLATGAYTNRYALPAVIGLSFLVVWTLANIFQARQGPAVVLAALFSCAFLMRALPVGVMAYDRSGVIRAIEHDLPRGLPIAVADPLLFFELSHQSPPDIRSRLFYVAEPRIALRRLGSDTTDRALIGMQTLASLQVKTLAGVINSRQKFLIVGYPPASFGWLVDELISLHVPLSVAGSLGNGVILLAEPGRMEAPNPVSGPTP